MLRALHMQARHKWTDKSFNENMAFWQERLPKGNKCPTSIEEAKKIVCPLDLLHVRYHACMRRETNVLCAVHVNTRAGRKLLEKWYGTF
jgi:hypothetical protein